jgi:hypothetical protein
VAKTLLFPEERAFLAAFIHEATTAPFTGPATNALHNIGVEYGDISYLAWAFEQEFFRAGMTVGHPVVVAPPLPWLNRESALRRNDEFGRATDAVVRVLKAILLPELSEFGRSVCRTTSDIATETFSHRHAACLHSLGLSCYPAGTSPGHEHCVALYVNVFDFSGLSVRGFVSWGWPSLHTESMTALYAEPAPRDLGNFFQEVRGLYEQLRAAARRGKPSSETDR